MAVDPSTAPATPALAAVSVKLPPFWPTDPEVWFAQVEAQFTTRGITAQKTKFQHVISSLSPEFAMEVRDLLLKPPADNPYDTLKAQLIKRTCSCLGAEEAATVDQRGGARRQEANPAPQEDATAPWGQARHSRH